MQLFRQFDTDTAALVGWGVRVMLLSPNDDGVTRRLAGLGGIVDSEADIFDAIETMANDPTGYGLFVMDCDAFGGLEAGRRALALMSKAVGPVPAILISRDCAMQEFPEDPRKPVMLRAPLSAVSLRVGFEHAMRERLMWQAA